MALENVEQFEKLLREDEALQERLASAVDAYEGEQTAEAIYEALLEPIAAGVGLPFTYEEAVRFGSLGRELSDALVVPRVPRGLRLGGRASRARGGGCRSLEEWPACGFVQ